MSDDKQMASRVDELSARFERLERHVYANSHRRDGEGEASEKRFHYCAVAETSRPVFGPDVSADLASAIWSIGRKWLNGTNLHYYLFKSGSYRGDAAQQNVVRQAFDLWKQVGIGIDFTEVTAIGDAELRIGFRHGNGSWSTIGSDALSVGQSQRTMNFGWNIDVPGPNGLDTAVHEMGHALGFHHEHQNPNSGIVWNEQAVYDHFARTQDPPLDRAKTDINILNKIDPPTVEGSGWDADSIMHYQFAAGLIREPAQYQSGLFPAAGLSQKDKDVVRRFYQDGVAPSVLPELKPWISQLLSLAPGEQKDFDVLPQETRNYNFRTFGHSDTVMVLFEEDGGDYRYVKGDDDSGYAQNASFKVRLTKGRKYQLKIRLYYSFASGDTAVMMW